MLRVLFTCDYEIEGDGSGSPMELMVEPTRRLFTQLDACGARLTVMCDVAEVCCFRAYRDETSRDDFAYAEIERQLLELVAAGHDVQLHLHPGYLSARHDGKAWVLDSANSDLASLPYPILCESIRAGKAFLEELLQTADPGYRCIAFRSGGWSMQPSRHLVDALILNGIAIDSSVFKYGVRQGATEFDYTSAPSELVPWPVDPDEICRGQLGSDLIEFPIYAENRPIWSFITRARIDRMRRLRGRAAPLTSKPDSARSLLRKYSWKADFNQCTGRQLIRALLRAEARYGNASHDLPFVLMGHSKLCDARTRAGLDEFLGFVSENPDRFCFGKFADFDLESFRTRVPTS